MDSIKTRLYVGHAGVNVVPLEYLRGIEALREGLRDIEGVEVLDDDPENVHRCDIMIAEWSFFSADLSTQMEVMHSSRHRLLWIFSAIGSQREPTLLGGPGSLQSPMVRFDQYPEGRIEDVVRVVRERLEYMRDDEVSKGVMALDRQSEIKS